VTVPPSYLQALVRRGRQSSSSIVASFRLGWRFEDIQESFVKARDYSSLLYIFSRLLGYLVIASLSHVVFMSFTSLVVAEPFNTLYSVFFLVVNNNRFR
jgi:hypothetical protein